MTDHNVPDREPERRPYEAPDVTRVQLRSDEVLSYGCKVGSTISKNTYCAAAACHAVAS